MMGIIGREEMGIFIELDSSVVDRNRHWSEKMVLGLWKRGKL